MQLRDVDLALWNDRSKDDNRPSIQRVRDALQSANLSSERAPDIGASTAFRRAAQALKTADMSARTWKRKSDGMLCAQVDRLEEREDGPLPRGAV